MEEIANETGVFVQKFDADENAEYMNELGVVSVPTVIHFGEDGEEIARIVGARPKAVALRELNL